MELTAATKDRLQALFKGPDAQKAERVLLERCGSNLPLVSPEYTRLVERVRFAVLKLSQGDLADLEKHVANANRDWRDVLVAAGFAHSPASHLDWQP